VAALKWLIVFFILAAEAAFFTLRRAAAFCFALDISNLLTKEN
jgi:hypothetical protein